VTRFARRLAGSGADADDVVQESYLCALRHWHTFTPGTSCRRWLFTICKHCFLRARAGSRRVVPLGDVVLDDVVLGAAGTGADVPLARVDRALAQLDLVPAVHAAIAALPEAFREVALLVDIRGYSYGDAARLLGIPLNTLRSRVFRARRHLRPALATHAHDAGLGASYASRTSARAECARTQQECGRRARSPHLASA